MARLPSLSLRGTFLKAYLLLIRIVSHIGWDELLKHRSRVFVMEDEYRIHRALLEEMEKETVNSNENEISEDHQAETFGVGQMSIQDDRGRSESRKAPDTTRNTSSTSPRKASVDVDKLLNNLPQKSDRSKSSDNKPPVIFFTNMIESTIS